jgi:hypothetical protein
VVSYVPTCANHCKLQPAQNAAIVVLRTLTTLCKKHYNCNLAHTFKHTAIVVLLICSNTLQS